MEKLSKIANDFEVKLAQQQYQVREYNMGNAENPNLANIIRNIQVLMRAYNAAMAQGPYNPDVLQTMVEEQLANLNIEIS